MVCLLRSSQSWPECIDAGHTAQPIYRAQSRESLARFAGFFAGARISAVRRGAFDTVSDGLHYMLSHMGEVLARQATCWLPRERSSGPCPDWEATLDEVRCSVELQCDERKLHESDHLSHCFHRCVSMLMSSKERKAVIA